MFLLPCRNNSCVSFYGTGRPNIFPSHPLKSGAILQYIAKISLRESDSLAAHEGSLPRNIYFFSSFCSMTWERSNEHRARGLKGISPIGGHFWTTTVKAQKRKKWCNAGGNKTRVKGSLTGAKNGVSVIWSRKYYLYPSFYDPILFARNSSIRG